MFDFALERKEPKNDNLDFCNTQREENLRLKEFVENRRPWFYMGFKIQPWFQVLCKSYKLRSCGCPKIDGLGCYTGYDNRRAETMKTFLTPHKKQRCAKNGDQKSSAKTIQQEYTLYIIWTYPHPVTVAN